VRDPSTADLWEIGIKEASDEVTSGLQHSLASEVDIPPLTTIQKRYFVETVEERW
jgi:hypothetical protein